MHIFQSRNQSNYIDFDPLEVPRRTQRNILRDAMIGILVVSIVSVLTIDLVNISQRSVKSGTNYILKATGDPKTTTEAWILLELEDVLVETDQGSLRGKRMKSRGGREYLAFIGIPYAKPPVGELRFQPPVEAEPWEGILNATTLTKECIQKDKYNAKASVYKGSEDCLYLNVYTPKVGKIKLKLYFYASEQFQ